MDKSVPIPAFLRQHPRWRGLPIPFTTFIGSDGIPDFKVVDHMAVYQCLRQGLCGLCGKRLKKPVVFIGGPLCVENRMFIDPGTHEECALYATKVCPYLANADGAYSKAKIKHLEDGQSVITTFQGASLERPDKLALIYSPGYTIVQDPNGGPGLFAKIAQISKLDWDTIPPSVRPDDESEQ